MRRVYFLAILSGVLGLALACGEREEYKGSGSKSLVDPTSDGSVISTSGGTEGDAGTATDGDTLDADTVLDATPDTFVFDAGFDAKG